MKTNIILTTIAFFLVMGSCKKNHVPIPDYISYREINKLIIASESDSIDDSCVSMVFYFLKDSDSSYHINIRHDRTNAICDAYYSLKTDPQTEFITPLEKNANIFNDSFWYSSNFLSLDNFSGAGERYIGYRECANHSGDDLFYYGWIKVKVSQNNDSILIISRATNLAEGNSILAGQTD